MELTKEPGQTQRHVEMCIYIYINERIVTAHE